MSADSGAKFKSIITSLGMNQRDVADFLGFSLRRSRRLAAGDTDLHRGEEILLKLLVLLALKPPQVLEMLGYEKPKKKGSKKKADAAAAKA